MMRRVRAQTVQAAPTAGENSQNDVAGWGETDGTESEEKRKLIGSWAQTISPS